MANMTLGGIISHQGTFAYCLSVLLGIFGNNTSIASFISNLSSCHQHCTGCFKKSFTNLKAYRNLYRGHTQGFELSKCSKTHRVLPRIVMVQCDFHW